MMNFDESTRYLLSLGNEVSTMKLGLENIRKLLAALGNPQYNYLKVQVAGTNGKGSVCAFLNSICNHAGIKTGLYTSPHLVSITERIKIDGVDISKSEFARLATKVREVSERLVADGELESIPTFFEQVTATALVAFAEARVELAILETGLGGRFDATTAANAEIAAITRIDLDHQQFLGDTIEDIAREKAAIIREDTEAVVVGRQSEEAMKVILERCRELELSPITVTDPLLPSDLGGWRIYRSSTTDRLVLETTLAVYEPISLGLIGRHQIDNAQTALLIAWVLHYFDGFDITDENLLDGLEAARHSGRLEYANGFLFDGAHNPAGAGALRDYLDEYETRPITMIFGAMQDKDIAEMAEILFPKAEYLILTTAENTRAMPAEAIAENIPFDFDRSRVFTTATPREAVDRAMQLSTESHLIVVTGSLYLIGDVKSTLATSPLSAKINRI